MKLYLASFLESENFGPGRLIGIATGSKPDFLEVEVMFPHLIPAPELDRKYRSMITSNQVEASKMFVEQFSEQLDNFVKDVITKAKEKNTDPIAILPFKEGDTLASWERAKYRNYRNMVAEALKKLGYDVVLN